MKIKAMSMNDLNGGINFFYTKDSNSTKIG